MDFRSLSVCQRCLVLSQRSVSLARFLYRNVRHSQYPLRRWLIEFEVGVLTLSLCRLHRTHWLAGCIRSSSRVHCILGPMKRSVRKFIIHYFAFFSRIEVLQVLSIFAERQVVPSPNAHPLHPADCFSLQILFLLCRLPSSATPINDWTSCAAAPLLRVSSFLHVSHMA